MQYMGKPKTVDMYYKDLQLLSQKKTNIFFSNPTQEPIDSQQYVY